MTAWPREEARTQVEETFDVEAVEVAFERALRQADAADHDGGEGAMPAGDAQPAAGAAGAVADDVDVGVDGNGGCRLHVTVAG